MTCHRFPAIRRWLRVTSFQRHRLRSKFSSEIMPGHESRCRKAASSRRTPQCLRRCERTATVSARPVAARRVGDGFGIFQTSLVSDVLRLVRCTRPRSGKRRQASAFQKPETNLDRRDLSPLSSEGDGCDDASLLRRGLRSKLSSKIVPGPRASPLESAAKPAHSKTAFLFADD